MPCFCYCSSVGAGEGVVDAVVSEDSEGVSEDSEEE